MRRDGGSTLDDFSNAPFSGVLIDEELEGANRSGRCAT